MSGTIPASNPFSTRHIRPGAIPYFFPPGVGAATLVEQLRFAGWWGQIVGPHGTGKSTLLAALLPEAERAGKSPCIITLHDGTRRLPSEAVLSIRKCDGPDGLIVVDGYEQLGLRSRFWLKWQCTRRGIGLLVTAHTSAGFPDLYRTNVTSEQAERVVDHLLGGRECSTSADEITGLLAAHGGNLREALFALYDLHERSCSRNRCPTSGRTMLM